MSSYSPQIFKTFDVSTLLIGGLEPELQILKVSTEKFETLSSFVYFLLGVADEYVRLYAPISLFI